MSYEENRYRHQVITELSGIRKALEKSNELMKDYIKTKTTLFISDDEIKPLYSGDNMKGSLRDIEILDELSVESILERADVRWYDNMIQGMRVVTSQNANAPLTHKEEEMLKRMWRNQGFNGDIIFFGVAED